MSATEDILHDIRLERAMLLVDGIPENEDDQQSGEIIGGAVAYATVARSQIVSPELAHAYAVQIPPSQLWRWPGTYYQPSDDPVRNLIRAGAFIVAEIERIQRERAS